MVQDPWMKEVFQNPPMVTYRRPPNLRNKLIRARIPDPPRMRPKRLIPGMKPCGLNCPTCPYIQSLEQLYNPLIPARRLRLMELSTVRPEM